MLWYFIEEMTVSIDFIHLLCKIRKSKPWKIRSLLGKERRFLYGGIYAFSYFLFFKFFEYVVSNVYSMFYYPRNWVKILSTLFWGMAQLSTMTTSPGKILVVGSRPVSLNFILYFFSGHCWRLIFYKFDHVYIWRCQFGTTIQMLRGRLYVSVGHIPFTALKKSWMKHKIY